jgi:vitamin B12 transporter
MFNRLCAAVLAALALPALAAPPTAGPEVVVTATRSASTVDDTLASVSIITREQIDASQAPDLLELLRLLPGVDVSRTGGPGQSTTLFLRGTNSNSVLVLIDGIRVSSVNSGLFDFAHLPLGQIERIELVRGPRAALWGSDAIGGVLQIFTREPDGPGATARFSRYATLDGVARFGARDDRGGFAATVSGSSAGGFSAQTPDGFAYDPDADGYLNRSASVRGDIALGSQRLAASAIGTSADVEFDQGESDAENVSLGVSLSGPLREGWAHALTVGGADEAIGTPAFFQTFDSRRESVDWIHDVALGNAGALVAGVNWLHEEGVNTDTFSGSPVFDRSRHNTGAFATWRGGSGVLDAELSGRYDDNSQFGGESTFQAAVGWTVSDDWRVIASAGEGFRAPNLNELYSPGFFGLFAGNPDLQPERSRSAELGVRGAVGAHALSAHAYRTRVRDLISFTGGETFEAENIGRAEIDGIELEWRWRGDRWGTSANATLQDPENADTGTALLRRPRRKFGLAVDRQLCEQADATLEGQYTSERDDFAGPLGSYTLVNARIAWRARSGLRLGARLDNATGRDYALAGGFGTPGRSLMFTIDADLR